MHFFSIHLFAALAFATEAQIEIRSSCPSGWTDISSELTTLFVTDGQCNDDARATIRAAFHDCFPVGGCDGSLLLELARPENIPLGYTVIKLADLAETHDVSMADMFQFGAAHAIASCQNGPRITTYIGRKDSCTPAPIGQIPGPNLNAQTAQAVFAARGFSTQDLSALLGAHTAARQFATNIAQMGASLDSTPGVWDTLYYSQTLNGTAPFSIATDTSMSQDSLASQYYQEFAGNKTAWDASFSSAMTKLSLLGTPGSEALVDCTDALP